MGRIHLEVESGQSLARLIKQYADNFYDSSSILKNQGNQLINGWQGGKSSDFVREIRNCTDMLMEYADQLDNLSVNLDNEINQWIAVDVDGDRKMGVGKLSLKPILVNDVWDNLDSSTTETSSKDSLPFLPALKDVIKGISLTTFVAETGVVLQNIAPWLIDNKENFKALGIAVDFVEGSYKDWNNPIYDTVGEKVSLLTVNLAFSVTKSLIKSGIKAGAVGLFSAGLTAGIAQGLTGIGIPTGTATTIASTTAAVTIWAGAEVSTNVMCDWFKDSSLKSEIIQRLGSEIDKVVNSSYEASSGSW